jgi:hypothetical protein
MTNFAKVRWNDELSRYELHIGGVLKAYAQAENDEEHKLGKDELIKLAEKKGYTVHVESRN